MNARILAPTILIIFLLFGGHAPAFSDDVYPFDCNEAKINASIAYSVIGHYKASFSECSGQIVFDNTKNVIKSVDLNVTLKSIRSNCGWCDKIVLSKRLLDANSYPLITFVSETIVKKEDEYEVSGILKLHGIARSFKFPFSQEDFKDSAVKTTRLKGTWLINRKDFNISWNKLLDHKGILVGNFVTVNWEIVLKK